MSRCLFFLLSVGCASDSKPVTDSSPDTCTSQLTYIDADGDGYGDSATAVESCNVPAGSVLVAGDCDDADDDINPGALEVCDAANVDEDCDGLADNDDDSRDPTTAAILGYPDDDGDGYGDEDAEGVLWCDDPGDGYAEEAGDCDDDNDETWPGAEEICNDGADNDCDGTSNECGLSGDMSLADADLTFIGESAYSYSGSALTGAGDVNGDGYDDVLIGAYFANSYKGAAYLVHGGPDAESGSLADADARLLGGATYDYAGLVVAGPGDLNGDGYAELLVGARSGGTEDQGAAYLLSGPISGDHILPQAGSTLTGVASSDMASAALTGTADLDSDGVGDLAIGAPQQGAGGAVTLLGGAEAMAGGLSLASSGLTLEAERSGDGAGSAVSSVSDLDGDGVADLLISATSAIGGLGRVYVLSGGGLGPLSGTLSLADADAIIEGSPGDGLGTSLGGGDLDGDGLGDVIIGSPAATAGIEYGTGAIHLLSGAELSGSLAAADGLMLSGEESGNYAGISVSGAGDVDGDGHADVIIGAIGVSKTASQNGAAYLYMGGEALSGTRSLSEAAARLIGPGVLERAGSAVSGGGDINGDGVPDLLVGASLAAGEGGTYYAGATYVVFGSGGL